MLGILHQKFAWEKANSINAVPTSARSPGRPVFKRQFASIVAKRAAA
jgi:hypothetical protein